MTTDPVSGGSRDVAELTLVVRRLEEQLMGGDGADAAIIDAVVGRARELGDNLLLGRVLCLLCRAQILHGQHELAIRTAQDGLEAFAQLDAAIARRCPGLHAEMFRAAGSALLKLGRIAEALPKLEEAVRTAAAGIAAGSVPGPYTTVISAQSTLIRSLVTLGIALFAIREIDTAIEVYYRAMAVADAYPETYEQFLDDVMLTRWNLTDALHERVKRRRAAGTHDLAAQDIAAARNLLDAEAWRIDGAAGATQTLGQRQLGGPLSPNGRAAYYSALGHHLLITAKPGEALTAFELQLVETKRLNYADDWSIADAQAGMAQAALALESPRQALEHSALALSALSRHDESDLRAAVLLVRARAHRALGEEGAAYDALAEHHALRGRLEAVAAQQYASHMTAQLGLERARADAESHRRIAAMLETLGRIGQEITAKLDADRARLRLVFGIEDEHPITASDIPVDDPYSLTARAVRERREIFNSAGRSDPHVTRVIRGTREMQTALFAPLIVADRVLGVVSIQSDQPDAYTENECSIFRTLSTYAAIALDNAAAYTKLEQTVVALQAIQSELGKQTAEFERLSMTDALTGVANRRHLNERAQVEIARMRRKAGHLAVAMFDIDHFKRVNDTYGHAVGDAVLQQIAQIAKQWLRPADLISRIGGEEFALLLPGVGIREAVVIAERIRSSIADTTVVTGNAAVRVTSSFGVAMFDGPFETFEHVLSRADAALYAAKQAGRDRVHAAP